MPDRRWKRQEREIARALRGQRLPNNGRGQADVRAGLWSVQVKTRASLPAWLVDAANQAERDARPDELPAVVLSEVRRGVKARRLVVLDFDVFAALAGIGPPADPPYETDTLSQ